MNATPGATPGPDADAVAKAAAAGANAVLPATSGASLVNHAIAIDLTTDWQPLGGAFRFDVSPAMAGGATVPRVFLCPTALREEFFNQASGEINFNPTTAKGDPITDDEKQNARRCLSLSVQALQAENTTPSFSKYQAALGTNLPESFVANASTYITGFDTQVTNGLFRRLLTGGWLHVHVDPLTTAVFRVGVTGRPLAAGLTLAVLLALAYTLASFAKTERVKGPGKASDLNFRSLPLRLVSGVDGHASLSQFQIMLWTFVVLGGAVYVVLVNGALIPISAGTLVLLGISGASAVIAQAKATQDAKSVTSAPAPGPVTEAAIKAIANSSDLMVSWSAPANPPALLRYRVRVTDVTNNVVSPDIIIVRDVGVRLVGLTANAAYQADIQAEAPPATQSAWVTATLSAATVAARAAAPAAALPTKPVLQGATNSTLTLIWNTPLPNSPAYVVQFRRADSTEDWVNAPQAQFAPAANVNEQQATLRGMDSGVAYHVRVADPLNPNVWSEPLRARTVHSPRWSDLVTDDDQPRLLDVTRVQMLLFTLVTAGFVTIKIIDSSVIPEVPQEYLVLMGISNGVYLTAKWARR